MDTSNYVCTVRRPTCFVEEDNGLASLADSEVGFSGNHHQNPNFCSKPLSPTKDNSFSKRRGSFRSLSSFNSSSSSPRSSSVRLYDARCEEHQLPHFLESCFLCKKPLGNNRDIFMYRGDTPFCSEECRQEQIEIDEAKEKNWNLSSMKAIRKDQQKSTPNKSRNYQVRTSTVAAA
ncbi:Protein of unknown function DUF581 [Macleaya cordata]|uniref:FLZ-type domain-containing protein n=1 Tax=Macleaya cordata TaxID=56857 RepID=A0A200QQG1_MACCD|nr:Protein of unknown function DUF581 [Macleaya cordata]